MRRGRASSLVTLLGVVALAEVLAQAPPQFRATVTGIAVPVTVTVGMVVVVHVAVPVIVPMVRAMVVTDLMPGQAPEEQDDAKRRDSEP